MIVDTQQLAAAYDQDLDTLGFSLSSIIKKVTGVVGQVVQPVLGIVQTVAGGTALGTAAGVIGNILGGGSQPAPAPPPPQAPPASSDNSGLVMLGVGLAALYLLSRSSRR